MGFDGMNAFYFLKGLLWLFHLEVDNCATCVEKHHVDNVVGSVA